MRRKWKSSVKSVWILLGIMLGMECFSSTRDPFALQMWSVRFAVVNYRAQEGKWPTSLDELTGPSYRFQKEDLIDPWGEPFGFECGGPEDDCIVWSTGPDKKLGTADDIVMGSSAMANRWRAKHGLPVVTNAVQTATQTSGAASPSPVKTSLWLYTGILLCLLCPILYFLRRKLKTRN